MDQFKDTNYIARVIVTPVTYQKYLKSTYALEIKEVGINIMDPYHTLSPLTKLDISGLLTVPEIKDDQCFSNWLMKLKRDQRTQEASAGFALEFQSQRQGNLRKRKALRQN